MHVIPSLGGISEKYAEAYLLRPTVKPKKKKKKKRDVDLDKVAADAGLQAVKFVKAAMQRRVQSGDLGGGWNPSDQLIEQNS